MNSRVAQAVPTAVKALRLHELSGVAGSIPVVSKLVWVRPLPIRRIAWRYVLDVSMALPRFVRNPVATVLS